MLSHQDSTTSIRAKNLRDFKRFTCTFIKIVLLLAFWSTLSSEILSCLRSKWIQRNIMRMKELTSIRRTELADKSIKMSSRKDSNEPNLLSPYLSKALPCPQPQVQSFVVIPEGHIFYRTRNLQLTLVIVSTMKVLIGIPLAKCAFPSTSNSFSVSLWNETDAHKEVWCHSCFQYHSKQTQPRWVP